MTPFKALYRRDPPTVACYIWGSSPSDLIETYLLDRDAIVDLLKANLVQVQTWIKALADKRRLEVTYEIGDQVYVKLKPYHQNTVHL